MPKMTTEQFLEHLGIEVGKPYLRDCRKETIVNVYTQSMSVAIEWEGEEGEIIKYSKNLLWFINQEITPLPKYTLSEDEKAIVRNIAEEFDIIGVDKDGVMYARNDNGLPTWLPFPTLFNFIKLYDEVSIDELRKCL